MAVMALAASAWLLGSVLIGPAEALAYLAPLLALLTPLAFERYPGESAYERRLAAARTPLRAGGSSTRQRHRFAAVLPRGGALLAGGLAGRSPPLRWIRGAGAAASA
jgi:hypothetical protein